MILTVNNDPTGRPKPGDQAKLAECDDIITYKECGWYCLIAYKGQKRVLHLHFNSQRELDFFVDPKKAAEHYFKDKNSAYRYHESHWR